MKPIKANELKHEHIFEMHNTTIWDAIEIWKETNPNAEVIDIKFAIMQNGENVNEVYREVLILYKDSEKDE